MLASLLTFPDDLVGCRVNGITHEAMSTPDRRHADTPEQHINVRPTRDMMIGPMLRRAERDACCKRRG
jgi:hypothetical protein